MSGKNGHVVKFIDYYCRLPIAPEYALLVKGPWGCGKSHLIKECIDDIEQSSSPVKFIFVSLYGVSAVEDIETKIFQILNPVLSSKGMVLAGRFAKGLLRGALKIDLDGDGKTDGTMSVGLPEINLADYLTDTTDCVLIFDDLERCSMPLQEILGYINYFVEKDGYKVMLIADENKLIEKCDEEYNRIKEKLIGKTLEVEADIDEIFSSFVDELIVDAELKERLNGRQREVVNLFLASGYGNLRSLRKMLMEFGRLWKEIDSEVRSKQELISRILDIFSLLSLEIYSGGITAEEIPKLIGKSTVVRRAKESRNATDSIACKYADIESKYGLNLYETLLDTEVWLDVFSKGKIPANVINSSLKVSKYFTEDNAPDWMKLWYLYDLEDEQFDLLKASVQKSFQNREYRNPGEIKHVAGMLLDHSRKGLANTPLPEVLSNILVYLEDVDLDVAKDSFERVNGYGGFAGLGYTDADSEEMADISKLLNQKIIDKQNEVLASNAGEILDAMKVNPMSLYGLICLSHAGAGTYYSRPILQYVDLDIFFKIFVGLSNQSKLEVLTAIAERFKHVRVSDQIIEEKDWLNELVSKLEPIAVKNEGRVSGVVLSSGLKRLRGVVDRIEAFDPIEDADSDSHRNN